ncbi:MAG: ComEC family competence protein [Cohaesibacter sp.]|jgi:competence protein ComEC|nr:ComEC family competence protein [Cohaesibacter sp.]
MKEATEKGAKEAISILLTKNALSAMPAEQSKARVKAEHFFPSIPLHRRIFFKLERFFVGFGDQWHADCDYHNARFLWSAFTLALGAASYFFVPDEPLWWAVGLAAGLLGVWSYRRAAQGLVYSLLLFAACALAGLFVSSFHGTFFATPVLATSYSGFITGQIEEIEYRAKDQRWIVKVEEIDRLDPKLWPRKVLLIRKAKGERFQSGDRIRAWSRLSDLARPVMPGGFDYGRYLWGRGIGAQGYLGRTITRLPDLKDSLAHRFWMSIERSRARISHDLQQRMAPEAGGLAAALMVGKRDGLDKSVAEALRLSGLAHILAISGLHMGLVTLTVFMGLRSFLSLFEGLVLRYPIKQWAAFVALFVATGYLLMSGAAVSTLRAYIMTGIFLLAVLLDRPALTLHNIALALALLIVFQPFAVVEPGLQMSFAATLALVAGYRRLERAKEKLRRTPGRGWLLIALENKILRWVGGVFATALIAGLATLPFSIAYFNQMAPLGLLANLLAMPVVTFLVMPMGLVSVLAVPFGLLALPLAVMEWGLLQLVAIANWVVGLTPSDILLAAAPAGLALFAAIALVLLALHHGRLAALSVIVFSLPFLQQVWQDKPALWIAESGRALALRKADGGWQIFGVRQNSFLETALLRSDGDQRAIAGERPREVQTKAAITKDALLSFYGCDREACSIRYLPQTAQDKKSAEAGLELANKEGTVLPERAIALALIKKPSAFGEECRRADIIISSLPAPPGCADKVMVFDKARLEQEGSQYLWFEKRGTEKASVTNSARGLEGREGAKLPILDDGYQRPEKASMPYKIERLHAIDDYRRPWRANPEEGD